MSPHEFMTADIPVPPFMTEQKMKNFESQFSVRDTDVFVVTYPKSGL